MDLGIRGRTALVTAASKGLGLGSAVALAEEGANVVICGRGKDALRDAEARIRGVGGEVLAVVADVTEPAAPAALVAQTVERFGALEILVANAGGPPPGRALDVTDEQLAAALNDNLLTSIRLVREAVPHMRTAGWGRICAITSFGIKQPIPGLALSNVARTALWAWAKTAAADLAPDNITLNLTAPGHHDTERMRKLGATDGPMGDPDDFGKVVAFLCSEPANFVNGVALPIDGGATMSLS
ncbi:MAG: short-chain dehydrogenase/reductase [Acidimicrobiales bacterium]|nr:short-chain dehydrogenase/reductase [Acidimicrobiales bacterium]